MAPPTPELANTVGWYILEGYPWWPVYICDQFKLRPNLHLLGDGHKKILKKAKDFPRDYALVYYFGSHDFSNVKLNKGILKPWDCSEKEQFLKGHPKHLLKKGTIAAELKEAIEEAEDFLSQPEDIRVPMHMVPSDLDPSLEPPPPVERPPPEEEEEEDGDEPMESEAEGDEDEDEAMEDDDEEETKKKKASKKKAAEKKKEKKPKKEKEKKEKKPKEKKEKKPAAPKKETKKEPKKEPKKELKRQRSSDELAAAAPEPKAIKKEKSADEDLAAVLEREIRHILSNEQYEEMTTKMLRKVLEERLKRDLKQHRETIKAVVTRVIEEEEDVVDAPGSTQEEAAPAPPTSEIKTEVKTEETVKQDPVPEPAASNGDVKKEPVEDPVKEEKTVKEEKPVEDETPIKDEKPVKEEKAEELAPPADATPEAAPPKPINEADILKLKEKLLDSETPHDELLSSLDELQQMPLEMSHLKHTGIARVVANLRQHANDKVSIAAKNLRNHWMQLAEKGKQPNNLKKLEKMHDVLESESESLETKLGVLQKLLKLSLSTQDIIDSKIGVVVSKMRKSSNAEIVEASQKLRKKWKKEAGGA